MSKHYKNKKVHQDSQYNRKHKPSKQAADEYYDYSDTSVTYREYNEIPKNRSMSFKKHYDIPKGRSVTFKNKYENLKDIRENANKYKRTYYSDTESENDDDDYSRSDDDNCYDTNRYKMDHRRKYSSESDMYQRTPRHTRRNTYSETETMIEDDSNSDSDYSLWETPRNRKESLKRQNTRVNNLYSGHSRDKNRHSRDATDTERSHYRTDLSVYTAHEQRGHRPFIYKRKESKLSDETDDEIVSDTEMQKYSATTLSQSQHHVCRTREMPKDTAFSREKVISVVDYNQDATLPKQKNKNTNNTDINSSDYLYVPVIVSDKPNISSELKLETPKEEEKLQNNVEVFVTDNLEQTNIFHQAHNTPNIKNKEQSPTIPKRSKISTAIKKLSSKSKKLNDNENDYPVKKAYINVAPNDKSNSKCKTPEPKKSKFCIGALIKKKQSKESEVETDKQSADNKGKTQDSSTALHDGPTKLNGSKNQTATQQQRSGILNEGKDNIPTSIIYDRKTSNSRNQFAEEKTKNTDIIAKRRCDVSRNEPRRSIFVRNVTDTGKQQRLSMAQKGTKGSHQMSQEGKGQQLLVERPVSDGIPHSRRSAANVKGKIEQTPSSETLKRKSAARPSNRDDVPKQSNTQKKSIQSTKKEKDMNYSFPQSTDSKTSSSHHPTTGGSDGADTGDPVKLWGYDITPLVYAFQTAQFFLGLTMHDKLMEIANQYYSN